MVLVGDSLSLLGCREHILTTSRWRGIHDGCENMPRMLRPNEIGAYCSSLMTTYTISKTKQSTGAAPHGYVFTLSSSDMTRQRHHRCPP